MAGTYPTQDQQHVQTDSHPHDPEAGGAPRGPQAGAEVAGGPHHPPQTPDDELPPAERWIL